MEGASNEQAAQRSPADHQPSGSGSHTPHESRHEESIPIPQESRHEATVEVERQVPEQQAMSEPQVVRRNAPVKRNYKELRKLGATDFYGTVDPTEAESWLKRTKRVFNMMHCGDEEKFDYAVSLLQDDAYDWWETVPDSDAQPPKLTWDDFQREFKDKYMPEIYRDEKQREFLNLKQGNMTVAESFKDILEVRNHELK
nr:PREDICTED: uncharacterized protein LOC108212539 [Daucus carota subsp. sativus]